MIESGRLVPVLDDWSWTGPPIGAMHPPNRFLSPKVQVFLDCARKPLAGVSPYRGLGWAVRRQSAAGSRRKRGFILTV